MKQILLLILFNLSADIWAISKCGDDAAYSPFADSIIKYHNVVPYKSVIKGKLVTAKDYLGTIRPLPKSLTLDDKLYKEGEIAYNAGNYSLAINLFTKVFDLDRSNPFVVNALARTFYKIEGQGGRSINAYIELMRIIEAGYLESDQYSILVSSSNATDQSTIIIDPWFLEAYWKLGTLYLDYQDYPKAILEMSKMYYYEFKAHKKIAAADRKLATELFAYLTEAYFHLKNAEANRYFACRTNEIDPGNDYIKQFILK